MCVYRIHTCVYIYIYKFIRFCRYFAESFGFTSLDGPTHTQTFTNTHTHTHHVDAARSSAGGGLSAAQRRAVLSAALRSGLFQAPQV